MATDHLIDPELLIPPFHRDNYVLRARDVARQHGTSVAEEWAAQVEDFRVQHETDGLAGWDHLAAWADTVDPETYRVADDPDPVAVRRMRVLESEKREPTDVAAVFDPAEQKRVAEEVAHARRTSTGSVFAGDDADGPEDKRRAKRGQRTAADSAPKRDTAAS